MWIRRKLPARSRQTPQPDLDARACWLKAERRPSRRLTTMVRNGPFDAADGVSSNRSESLRAIISGRPRRVCEPSGRAASAIVSAWIVAAPAPPPKQGLSVRTLKAEAKAGWPDLSRRAIRAASRLSRAVFAKRYIGPSRLRNLLRPLCADEKLNPPEGGLRGCERPF